MTPTAEALKSRLNGRVAGPDDPDWDEARRAWNLAVDQHPEAVVFAESTEDVVAAVESARDGGQRVAAQGTGHGAMAMGSLEGTVLVKTGRMTDLQVDPGSGRARVGAGVLWNDLSGAAAPHGLVGLQGSAGDVGVVGYSIGGGLGWLARKHGLAANRIVGAQVVLADGRVVETDAGSEPDLFWALRGGGGSFGVVTSLDIELLPLRELYAGVLFFPQERAAEVLPAWRDWADGVPDEMTSLGRLLNVPDLPMVPEPVRGKSFVLVEAAWLGDEAAGADLLAPLRELGPAMDSFAMIPPPGLAALHMDPPEPVPGAGDGLILGSLDDAAIQGVLDTAGPGSGTPLLSVEFRHLEGALGRPDPDGGAASCLRGKFAEYAVGMAMTPEMRQAVDAAIDSVCGVLSDSATGSRYLNFTERETDRATMFPEGAYGRLGEVKHAYDPDDVFRSNHPIAPTAG